MVRSLEDFESLRKTICQSPYCDAPSRWLWLRGEIQQAATGGTYLSEEGQVLKDMLAELESDMKPNLGFLGGAAVG